MLDAATIAHWQGGSGNWSDLTHWDIGVVPNNVGSKTYSAIIDLPASDPTVTVDMAVTISGLSNSEVVNVASAKSLTVSGIVTNTGDLTAAGGTLRFSGATVTNAARTIVADGGIVEIKDSTIDGGVLRVLQWGRGRM
ncbi:MAG: hypothetical protein NTY19_03405, partial [Planctomycetota bacterium]|nr:hypothetical protein [Planctomycetota bacterium]